jgi:hypothetical protein
VSPAVEDDTHSYGQTAISVSTASASPDTPPCIHIESCGKFSLIYKLILYFNSFLYVNKYYRKWCSKNDSNEP